MRFDRCYVTNSLCGPSRAVVQTGKYSHKNGFYKNGDKFDGSQPTMPKMLQAVGYQTAIVGKWHLESDPTGFNYWNVLPGQGEYYNPVLIDNGTKLKHTGYVTDIITDLALNWLKKKRDPKKPFLLMYQNKAPHRSWLPPIRKLHQFDDQTIPQPPTYFDDYSHRASTARSQRMEIARDLLPGSDLRMWFPMDETDVKKDPWWNHIFSQLTPAEQEAFIAAYTPKNDRLREANLNSQQLASWKYQRFIKDYLRCVDAVDEGVGRILDYLDQSGLADNTIVVYTSDQGVFLGEHGWLDKRWMYEPSLRTPLLVRWPGKVKPGSASGDIVSNVDFAETFLDVAVRRHSVGHAGSQSGAGPHGPHAVRLAEGLLLSVLRRPQRPSPRPADVRHHRRPHEAHPLYTYR